MEKYSIATLTATILVGGMGTRLRPVIADRPKVLAPVNGRPFLFFLLDWLGAAGVRRVVLCTGYRGDLVEAELGSSYQGLELQYSCEGTALGTGGALCRALPLLNSDPVLVLNGDSFCAVAIKPLLEWHSGHCSEATIVVIEVPDVRRYGRVHLGSDGSVRQFDEKKPVGLGGMPESEAAMGWVNAGVYLVSQQFLGSIPADRAVSLEREVFPSWVGRGLYGYRGRFPFIDIGTPQSYAEAAGFLAAVSRTEKQVLDEGVA